MFRNKKAWKLFCIRKYLLNSSGKYPIRPHDSNDVLQHWMEVIACYICVQTSPVSQIDKVNPCVILYPQSTSCPSGGVLEENTFCQWNRICESAIWTREQRIYVSALSSEVRIWDIRLTWGRRTVVSEGGAWGRRPGLNRHTSDQRMQLNRFCNWMPQTQALHPPWVTFWLDPGCKRQQEAVLIWKDWHEMLCFHSETWCEDLVLMAWLSWSC